jgi:hypothetical protein
MGIERGVQLIIYLYVVPKLKIEKGRTNPGHLVAVTTTFFTVLLNMSGSSVRNLLHITLLAPTIFRWLLDFLKIYAPLKHSYTTAHGVYRVCKFATAGVNANLAIYRLPPHGVKFYRQYSS